MTPPRVAGFLVLVLLTTGLAGCFTPGEPTESASTSDHAHANTVLNPWQRGLEDHHPTPDHVETRSADERRANVAPPGDPEFADFDATMQAWLEKHDITAGQLALTKDGELRYTRGYGQVDPEGTQAANESTMFRIASVTKPMTATVVALQVEQGLYNWTDPVFCLSPSPAPNCRLPIEPHPANPVEDERIRNVTVRQLIEHTAGWGASATWLELSPGPIHVAEELGTSSPPPSWRVGQYLLGEPLEHAPGERFEYCNICYMLAGLVAEAATGADLAALYDAYLFRPLDLEGEIERGYTRPQDRNPREPHYPCEPMGDERQAPNIYAPNETACWPDGGLSMEDISLGLGGIVGTAAAVAAVYDAYTTHVPSEPCGGGATCHGHFGSFPGTHSGALLIVDDEGNKAQFVYLLNSAETGDHCDHQPHRLEVLGIGDGCERSDLANWLAWLTVKWALPQDLVPDVGMAGEVPS